MAWTFSGTFLDGFAAERVIAGTGGHGPALGHGELTALGARGGA